MNRLEDIKNFVLWFVKLFRTPLSIYVVVSKNHMKVRNLANEKTASGKSSEQFSSDRLLIADPIKAENFAINLVHQIVPLSELKTKKLKVICHPLDNELANLSPAEKMIFTDFASQIGGSLVYLIEDEKELTTKELNLEFSH